MNNPSTIGFNRTLINSNTQVRSVCKTCEFVILSSLAEGSHANLEAAHLLSCGKRETRLFVLISRASPQAQ
jgi:hypothetical protein